MIIKKGKTDVITYFNLVDSTAGTPETALTITNIDATYTRAQEAAVKNDLTALAAVTTAHTDNKGIEVDATNAPGLYRVDWPDAAFATGVDRVILTVTCTGVAPAHLIVELVNYDPTDGVRLGLTALPNAAADAAGGLIISDAGGLDADAQRSDVAAILVDTGTTLDGRIPAALVGGRIDANVGAISSDATAADNAEAFFDGTGYAGTGNVIPTVTTLTGHTPQTGDSYAIVNSGVHGNAAIKGYVDDIGTAGAGLTAIPWNAAWDAEVQSEVEDALVVHRLDELLNADSDIDGAAPPTVGSVFHELMTKTAISVKDVIYDVKSVRGRRARLYGIGCIVYESTILDGDYWGGSVRVLQRDIDVAIENRIFHMDSTSINTQSPTCVVVNIASRKHDG